MEFETTSQPTLPVAANSTLRCLTRWTRLLIAIYLFAPIAAEPVHSQDWKSEDLEVVDFSASATESALIVSGKIKNLSGRELNGVTVRLSLGTGSRSSSSQRVPIDRPDLPAGAVSRFRATKALPASGSVTGYSVDFRSDSGATLYLRGNRYGGKHNESQLVALKSQASEMKAERDAERKVQEARSARLMPAWWQHYDQLIPGLRAAEARLRKAINVGGAPEYFNREVAGLKSELLRVAQALSQAPDPAVQTQVRNMLLKLASVVESWEAKAMVRFRTLHSESAALFNAMEQLRRQSVPQEK